MIRVVVVDDEKPARDRLVRLLGKHDDVEVVGEAENGRMALQVIATLKPALVFLDIHMPELDGLGVAQTLGDAGPDVVFATAYDEFALQAFDAAALDYLVKPISPPHLARALDRHRGRQTPTGALAELVAALAPQREATRIALKNGSAYTIVDPEQVTAIVAQDHYAVVTADSGETLCDETLDALHARLPANRFLRIHRSAIVNIHRMTSLAREGDRKYFAVMVGDPPLRLPISRDRLAEVKRALGID